MAPTALVLASCSSASPVPAMEDGRDLRHIAVWVDNAGDPVQELRIVDEADLTETVGIASPASVPGRTSLLVRLAVPDHVRWVLTVNGGMILSAGEVGGHCGTLPVRIHAAWGALGASMPMWFPDPNATCEE